jgi:hypothetical protein
LPRFELATTISLVKISLGGKVALADLSDTEREVVRECLRAAVEGPFFPEWEFHTLFGVTRAEVKGVVNSWPNVDESDETVILAINNSLNNLLGYPLGREEEDWPKFISVSREEVGRIFLKWKGQRVRNYFSELM